MKSRVHFNPLASKNVAFVNVFCSQPRNLMLLTHDWLGGMGCMILSYNNETIVYDFID